MKEVITGSDAEDTPRRVRMPSTFTTVYAVGHVAETSLADDYYATAGPERVERFNAELRALEEANREALREARFIRLD